MSDEPPVFAEILKAVDHERDRLVAAVVHLNDTYLLEERPEQQLPGFARVSATIHRLREHVHNVVGKDRTLVLHSGDFLAPSRVGKETDGRLMVAVLNEMGLDFCTLGNHEFDYGMKTLRQRLLEASFGVLLSNVTTSDVTLRDIALWPQNDSIPLVALTGVVSKSVHLSFPDDWTFSNPVPELLEFAEKTWQVPFHLVLTHATREEDRLMRQAGLPHRTYFLGGHDHDIHWAEEDGILLLKNLANLQTVRVLLLLAGGTSIWYDLYARQSQWDWGGKLKLGREPVPDCVPDEVYRQHIDWLFEKVHPIDAVVLRRLIPDTAPRLTPEAAAEIASNPGSYGVGAAALDATVMSVMGKLNLLNDRSFVLHRCDHLPPDPKIEALVAAGPSRSADENQVVCDLAHATQGPLEARDAALRRFATDFGNFVAECIRRQAGADVAILNAGSFRCDALLPPTLRLRDLRDVFLYDSTRAILVLDLPRAAVTAVLEHGRTRAGNGAYPQTAPDEIPNGDPLRVAIARYLVADPTDGYDIILATSLSTTVDTLRSLASSPGVRAFSVIDAVIAQASHVPFRPLALVTETSSAAEEFIRLADRLVARLGKPPWSPTHRDFLRGDDELDDAEVQRCRDDLRLFLRNLPEVHNLGTYAGHARADQFEICSRYRASMGRLRALGSELGVHIELFRKGVAYHGILNDVANGIGGWQT
jgi:2',3'-cyclic-nucleotide 2'-phosphodiesterase (5'-nucleotidase family)